MAKSFVMEIVTPARKVLSVEVESLIAPGIQGYIGILANHAPLVTNLGIGCLRYKTIDGEGAAAITGGFMEVNDNLVTIMADTAELSCEIDAARAKRAEQRARERLEKREHDTDVLRAELALKRALVRQEAKGDKD